MTKAFENEVTSYCGCSNTFYHIVGVDVYGSKDEQIVDRIFSFFSSWSLQITDKDKDFKMPSNVRNLSYDTHYFCENCFQLIKERTYFHKGKTYRHAEKIKSDGELVASNLESEGVNAGNW